MKKGGKQVRVKKFILNKKGDVGMPLKCQCCAERDQRVGESKSNQNSSNTVKIVMSELRD